MPRNATAAAAADPASPPTDETDDNATAADAGPLDALASRADETLDAAVELARVLPETVDRAAATTGRALGDAQRTVRRGSDAALLAGASMTAGLALGLLVGSVPRLVVAVALVPAAMLAIALVDRRSERPVGDGILLN
jgi:hypothetical protein